MIAGSEVDYQALSDALDRAKSKAALSKSVANAPFTENNVPMALLFLGFISLFLVDEKTEQVYLAGTSDTEHYRLSVRDYPFDPKKFRLPLADTKNHIVKAVVTGKPVHNHDWSKVSRSQARPETVRLNQATSGIATVYIYPLTGKRRGALMYNFFQYNGAIGDAQFDFMQRYTALVSAAFSR